MRGERGHPIVLGWVGDPGDLLLGGELEPLGTLPVDQQDRGFIATPLALDRVANRRLGQRNDGCPPANIHEWIGARTGVEVPVQNVAA